MQPPNNNSIESDIAVESRRKTEFTFTFSLKTSQGNGILASLPLTELWKQKREPRLNCHVKPLKKIQIYVQHKNLPNKA